MYLHYLVELYLTEHFENYVSEGLLRCISLIQIQKIVTEVLLTP